MNYRFTYQKQRLFISVAISELPYSRMLAQITDSLTEITDSLLYGINLSSKMGIFVQTNN